MARNAKLSPGIQVFLGSRPRQDVFSKHALDGCCPTAGEIQYDKLAERTRFDNALAHSNPLGAVDRFEFPFGDGFADTRNNIINGINENGVGYNISVLAVPTNAFVTGVSVMVMAEEAGLTFDLVTRNGLVLPQAKVLEVTAEAAGDCLIERTVTVGDADSFKGIGALNGNIVTYVFGRDGDGQFSLEADEIVLRVASMPAGGFVKGTFAIKVGVGYEVIQRAEV